MKGLAVAITVAVLFAIVAVGRELRVECRRAAQHQACLELAARLFPNGQVDPRAWCEP